MADVMLKNAYGENKTYDGIQTVTLPTSDGGTATFSLGGSGNTDWAQTDASQNDFIKNKPFGEIDVIPEQEFTFESDDLVPSGRFYAIKDITDGFVDGQTYKVLWDGVEYGCVAKRMTEVGAGNWSDEAFFIGNPAVYGALWDDLTNSTGEWVDTTEPFCVWTTADNDINFITTDTTKETHTIRIIEEKKIDKKWLPGDVASSWNDLTDRPFYLGDGAVTEVFPATTLPFDFSESDGFYACAAPPTSEQMALWQSDWSKAIITWGDTEYECEPKSLMGVKAIGNIDMLMGTGNTDEPFIMFISTKETMGEDMIMIIDVESTPTADGAPTVMRNIAISMVSYDIHTLDPKFLGDVPWNKVSDAPFGEFEVGSAVFDENAVYDAIFFLGDLNTGQSNINETLIIENATYSIEINGVLYDGTGMTKETLIQNLPDLSVENITKNGIAIYQNDSLCGAVACISNIMWVIYLLNVEGLIYNEYYPVKITVVEAVKKLDAKYLAPFEYTNGLVEFLPETTITTAMNDDYGVYFNGLPVTQDMYERWQANTDIVQVTFDGIVYNCAPQLVGGYYGVGNGAPFGGEGNNEPFVVAVVTEDDYYYLVMFALTDTTNTNHKLSVSIMGRTSTLRKEALPKDAIKAYIDEYIGDILGGDY